MLQWPFGIPDTGNPDPWVVRKVPGQLQPSISQLSYHHNTLLLEVQCFCFKEIYFSTER